MTLGGQGSRAILGRGTVPTGSFLWGKQQCYATRAALQIGPEPLCHAGVFGVCGLSQDYWGLLLSLASDIPCASGRVMPGSGTVDAVSIVLFFLRPHQHWTPAPSSNTPGKQLLFFLFCSGAVEESVPGTPGQQALWCDPQAVSLHFVLMLFLIPSPIILCN